VLKRLVVVVVVVLAFAPTALGVNARHAAASVQSLPVDGVLAPGKSLGGIRIGQTAAQVIKAWGRNYKVCPKTDCKGAAVVWYYIYSHGDPLGAAVRFRNGKVVAVFTLGSPAGWHTAQGLLVGDSVERANQLYGQLGWSVCIGYGAMTMRNGTNTVTSIFTTGEAIYGFAITKPGETICQ